MLDWLTQHEFYGFLVTVAIAVVSYSITRHFVLRGIQALVKRTKTVIDDFIFRRSALRWGAMLVPLGVFMAASAYLGGGMPILLRIASYALFFCFLLLLGSILHGIGEYLFSTGRTRGRPLKGYVQAINMVIYLYGAIVIAASIANTNPIAVISGLSAVTAVALLIFRDAILNFVASITITSYDLIRVGDVIESTKFGANGEVVDIALYVVKVRNIDRTVSVIPTYKLIDESFRNWREVREGGIWRIGRSLYIDPMSVHICDKALLERLESIPRIADRARAQRAEYAQANAERGLTGALEVYGRRSTNIGLFRLYVEGYLREHPMIRQDMPIVVRMLQLEPLGLPLELVAFVNSGDAPTFEGIQSEIFEHLLSVMGEFGLERGKGA